MSRINKKLGNGFVFNSVDSSKDDEHYFGGAVKTVSCNLRPDFFTDNIIFEINNSSIAGACTGLLINPNNKSQCFASSVGSLYKSNDRGQNWTVSTSSFIINSFWLSSNYIWTANFESSDARRWKIYRAHLTSSLDPEDYVLVDYLQSGSNANGQVGIFWSYTGFASSDSTVYVGGKCVSGSLGNQGYIIRKSTNADTASPVFETIVFSSSTGTSDISSNPPNGVNFITQSGNNIIASVALYGSPQYVNYIITGSSTSNIFDFIVNFNTSSIVSMCNISDGLFISTGFDARLSKCRTFRNDVYDFNNWNVVDEYSGSAPGNHIIGSDAFSIVKKNTSTGEIVVGGIVADGEENFLNRSFILRKSIDEGSTWFTFYKTCPLEATSSYSIGNNLLGAQKFDFFSSGEYLVGYAANNNIESDLIVKRIYKADYFLLSASVQNSTKTGSFRFECEFSTQMRDSENNYTFSNDQLNDLLFRVSSSQFEEKYFLSDLEFKMSCSNVPFVSNNYFIAIKDNANYPTYTNICNFGSFSNIGNEVYQFNGRLPRIPTFSFNNVQPVVKISCSLGITRIYDFKLKYEQPLSNTGVRYVKTLENQNMKFNYLKTSPLKKV